MRIGSFVLIYAATLWLSGCTVLPGGGGGEVSVVQITDAGDVAISGGRYDRVILWDLEEKTSERLTRNAEPYSAAISPNGRFVFWQERDGTTHLKDLETQEVAEQLIDYRVFGAAISNEGRVLVSDPHWSIRLIEEGQIETIRKSERPTYVVYGQILSLEWSRSGNYFLSAAFGEMVESKESPPFQERPDDHRFDNPVLWSAKTLEPEYVWAENSAKLHATLNLDGEYLLSGAENMPGYVIDGPTGEKKHRLASLRFGVQTNPGADIGEGEWDDSGLIDPPEGFLEERTSSPILAMRFITDEHFLRISTHKPWVILYHVDDPLPKKYFPLGESPFPAVSEYRRHEASAAAPEGNVFVIGRQRGRGILVYEFDEEAMTFEQVWTPRR